MMGDTMRVQLGSGRIEADAVHGSLTRRDVLKGLGGTVGLAVMPGLLAACGTSGPSQPGSTPAPSTSPTASIVPSPSESAAAAGVLTLASYFPGGPNELVDAFQTESGIDVKVATVDAASFGDQVVPYLSASPEDVITTAAGKARQVGPQGLATPIDDVWASVGSRFPASIRAAATAADGHQYFMPATAYGWVMFYRPDVFAQHGYTIPATWTEFKTLAGRMLRDGLIPMAMADAEVFEADGVFDMLDLRLNGYRFHMDLITGAERWTDSRVRRVFERWREIVPFTQAGAVGRNLDDAIRALVEKHAGMYLMGSGIMMGSGIVIDSASAGALDVFPFPFFGNEWDAEKALDVPTDGYMVTRNSRTLSTDLNAVKAFIEYVASAPAQALFAKVESGTVAPAADADMSGYDRIQRKVHALIGAARGTPEFLDRDTDYGFAFGVGSALQDFITHPDQDLDPFLRKIQGLWDKH
jgi:multiple sugar transport system substrate-binding protein